MCSTVFADLLEFPEENVFPTPFPAWLLQEIRHVCYFGTFSFHDLQSVDDDTIRKHCQLLVAMDYYQLENALSEPIYNSIVRRTVAVPGLACVIMDEFGLGGQSDSRPWIAKSVEKASGLLADSPYKVLLPETSNVGGVCSIQDANTIQQILARNGWIWNKATVWVKFEALYTWANADPSNRAAAATELWEETGMLEKLKADDPEYFADRDDWTLDADSFCSNQDFAELCQHASEKNAEKQAEALLPPYTSNNSTAQNASPHSIGRCCKDIFQCLGTCCKNTLLCFCCLFILGLFLGLVSLPFLLIFLHPYS